MQVCVSNVLVLVVSFTAIYLMICWIGHFYVKAEVSRVSNEKLLDNLDEGLFILEE